ncbi:hypothetical protein [Shimia gijangensis]|uniref:hypothetical protein n=1 Tax=Shimia gijangensis TaxID=1470563 RepID=UPI0011148464|nr:hypothetical protein [Shimia gijangensis]
MAATLSTIGATVSAQDSTTPLHNQPTRFVSFETANTYRTGTVELSFGTTQTDPRSALGTGNQLYFGGGSYSLNDRLTFGFDLHNYVDDAGGPIGGVPTAIEMTTLSGWGKYQLYSDSRWTVSALVALESFLTLESPIFGGTNTFVMSGAFKAPITYNASQKLQFHVTPSVYYFPGTVGGQNFYGTIASLGFGASYKANDRLGLFGSVDVPLSGTNTISSSGAYEDVPVWTAGGRYNVTPKIALEGYVTNGIGMTPGTSILTFWPDGDTALAGLRLIYTPGAKITDSYRAPLTPVTLRQRNVQQDGFTMGSADVLEPGTIRTSAWYGSDSNTGIMFGFSPDQDSEIQVIFEQYSDNPTADPALVPTTDVRYMFGPKLRFMDQNNGDAFSLSGRALYGRRIGSGALLGVFFAELIGSYKTNGGTVFTVNPKLAAFGSTEIAGLGLGVNYAFLSGLELIAEVTPVGLDGSDPTWAAGLRYTVGTSGFTVDAQATNAIGRYGIGGMIAQDDTRIALTVSKVFDVTRLKFY